MWIAPTAASGGASLHRLPAHPHASQLIPNRPTFPFGVAQTVNACVAPFNSNSPTDHRFHTHAQPHAHHTTGSREEGGTSPGDGRHPLLVGPNHTPKPCAPTEIAGGRPKRAKGQGGGPASPPRRQAQGQPAQPDSHHGRLLSRRGGVPGLLRRVPRAPPRPVPRVEAAAAAEAAAANDTDGDNDDSTAAAPALHGWG